MKNKFIILFIISIVCSVFVYGQTTSISIGNVTADPGEMIFVPIEVTDLTDVGAMSLYISYDPSVLVFQGLSNLHAEVAGMAGNATTDPDQIRIIWTAPGFPPDYANISSGKMLDLEFHYVGGSCDLVFDPLCDLVDSGLQPIVVNYSGGSVGPNSQSVTATIGSVTASPGEEVLIPVDVTDFMDVGAITFFIGYDESVLTFLSLENIHPDIAGVFGNPTTNPTEVRVIWVANPPNYADIASGKLFDLKFVYHGGECDLTFGDDCEVSDSGTIPIFIDYIDGDISQTTTSITAELGNVTASIGQEVNVPLDVTNFADVGAITFYISYDPAVLSYVGIDNIAPEVATVSVNSVGDQILVAWNDEVNFLNYSGKLFDLKFIYNGGTSDLTFDPNCEVADSFGQPLMVTYISGSVSVASDPVTIKIDTVFNDIGFEVLVPVNATDFLDIGAMTLFVEYNPAALSYIGLENVNTEISGVAANIVSNPYRIAVAWTATYPNFADIGTGKLFDLKFIFNGGDGNLIFSAGCEVTDSNNDIVPTTLISGGVFAPVYTSFKAFLEGPFNGVTMDANINSKLPLSQPYDVEPWFYTGAETVASIPGGNIIDWVLIELRETPFDAESASQATVLGRRAGFMLDNGTIVDSETLTPIRFDVVATHNLYGIIWHRNHLGIMSSIPLENVAGVNTYDFTTAEDQAHGNPNPQIEVAPGVWGMISGDGNKDGTVDLDDKANVWAIMVGQTGYIQGDFNMDSQVNNSDKNERCLSNEGNQTRVPE